MKNPSLSRSILVVAIITLVILSVPFVAMQLTEDVNWSVGDFTIMGVLIFSAGLAMITWLRNANNLAFKIGVGVGLGTTFLLIWANLAVGLIGSGPHAGNLMYIGVLAVCGVGCIRSGFKGTGMSKAMYASAMAVVLVGAIALLAGMDKYPASSVNEILGVTGFFGVLYAIAGYCFQFAAQASSTSSSQG